MEDREREALLVECHRAIEERSDVAAMRIVGGGRAVTLVYPPDAGFTSQEREALASASIPEEARGAIRKIVANSIGEVLLETFGFIDCVATPAGQDDWPCFRLTAVVDQDPDWLQMKFLPTY